MNILALEPYYGGSHKAFINGLSGASRHNWTVLTLPAHKWKWRMRHSAITFADQIDKLMKNGRRWDLLFCSDMLNLAEFVALAPQEIACLPRVVYFHENQLTYPVQVEAERDCHFAMTNLTSALAADAVWFNSHFHMDSFLEALERFLKSMPDHQPLRAVEQIREKSSVHPPGIAGLASRGNRKPGPLRILWAARWEHDKNPEDFFKAIRILRDRGVRFRLSVIGQSFREQPPVFARASHDFRDLIDHWGYQQSRKDYVEVLREADLVVSTARHEFFGIGLLEAVAAGSYPIVPDRLSYPEILGRGRIEGTEQFFYDGTVADLSRRLTELAACVGDKPLWPAKIMPSTLTNHLIWVNLAPKYDEILTSIHPLNR